MGPGNPGWLIVSADPSGAGREGGSVPPLPNLRTVARQTRWNKPPAPDRYDFECITNGRLLGAIAWIGSGKSNLSQDKTPDFLIEQYLGHTHKYNYFNN